MDKDSKKENYYLRLRVEELESKSLLGIELREQNNKLEQKNRELEVIVQKNEEIKLLSIELEKEKIKNKFLRKI